MLELLLTMGLALLLLAVSAVPRGGKAATSQGLAQILAEELRASRVRAMTTGKAVAVVVPSGGGTVSHSQSFYLMEGFSAPSVSRVVNFAGEFPRSSLFVGVWDLSPPLLRNASLTNTAIPQSAGFLADGFDPARWLPDNFRDFALIFTPSGGVTSNGLTSFDGDFHVLVSQGVTYSPGSVPPPGAPLAQYPVAYRRVSAAGKPYTVNLSRTGSVTVTEGVTGSISVTNAPFPLESGANPQPPRLAATPNHAPEMVEPVEARPKPVLGTLPTGSSLTLGDGGHVSMRVRAKDVDGDTLWVRWVPSAGKLSNSEEVRMEPVDWVGKVRVWEATLEWYPPSGSWTSADLTYQVSDRRGGLVTGSLGTTPRVSYLAPGRLAFVRDDSDLCVCKPDGTSVKVYSPDQNPDYSLYYNTPVFSPDGTRLALGTERYGNLDDSQLNKISVFTSDLRVAHETNLAEDWDSLETPSWNPTGTRLGVIRTKYDADYNVTGSNITDLKANTQISSVRPGTSMTISRFQYARQGNRYCYLVMDPSRPDASDSSIMVGTVGGAEMDLLQGTPTPQFADDVSDPSFSPQGDRIVYCSGYSALKVIPSIGGTSTNLGPGATGYWPIWAPVGDQVAYFGNDDRLYVTAVGGVSHLVSGGYLPWAMAWAPDASQLVFSADLFGPDDADSNFDLFRVDVDGNQLVNLTNSPDKMEDYPCWSRR